MKIEQDKRRFDFHAIGKEIKEKRKARGMTQEELAYIVDRAPRTIMYNEMTACTQPQSRFIRWSRCLIYLWISIFTRPKTEGASAGNALMPC